MVTFPFNKETVYRFIHVACGRRDAKAYMYTVCQSESHCASHIHTDGVCRADEEIAQYVALSVSATAHCPLRSE